MPTQAQKLVDERVIAEMLNMSIDAVRRDRQRTKTLPFYKINGTVRYDLDRVREVLRANERGGAGVPA